MITRIEAHAYLRMAVDVAPQAHSASSLNAPSHLPTNVPSAFIGQPPNNVRDYYIIKGLFRMVGMKEASPMKGYFFAARPPPGYVHESRAVGVQSGLIVVMLAIIVPTSMRVFLRARKKQMRFGWDDWTVIAAGVRQTPFLCCPGRSNC